MLIECGALAVNTPEAVERFLVTGKNLASIRKQRTLIASGVELV
jgi:hypothetical protein